ncbi:VIT domain-containing protein [Flavobacterium poyangense]|uniref:VIT domain-containing protein n=1 Tax=Flavobacterium poyangense TaxID=2204302 RepID=UPI001423157F|nr:VIT domain-containing protein [Flavobacterium sp. JXAS1]
MKSKMYSFKPENFQVKLNLLFYVLLFLGAQAFAQSPELTVKGEEGQKVRMSQLLVNVKVVGNIAYTTAEMHFFNSGSRQMEAELIFPLPENVSVSRYAIDINGKMREAVPVNKNKGKQVFEAIEHRRVDPGLLEKVDGNNFRTRIYPLMPNGERIVIIGYEEELSAFDKNNLAYQLVSRYPVKLDKFELNVSVLGAAASPTIAENSGEELAFSKWNQSFQTSLKKENYQPSEKLLFKIPIQQNIPSVVMQTVQDQHYFYGSTFVEGNKTAKKMPASIGLIWDNSLSCQNRDLKKELDLLDAYFQKIKNTTVTLYFLNYTFEKDKEYVISGGNWSALKNVLQNTKYDGGTRFSKVNFANQDEFLFFSDGLSSLSENVLPKTNKPIYAITSSVSADFTFLNYASMQSGGSFINLNQLNSVTALEKLTHTTLKFLGIKENGMVTDLYPRKGASVSGNFSFAGISLSPKNEITLLFGYTNEAIVERKITLDALTQNTTDVSIEKLWAQKKIANLDLQYDKNAEEIELLGKKYGIITKNTSLIVLEDIRDYIAYDIVPPAELRAEFDRIKKQEHDSSLAKQKNNWENIDRYFASLNSWWKENTKYTEPKPLPKPKVKPNHRPNTISQTTFRRNSGIERGYVTGVVLDEQSLPLPGASVRSDVESVSTDFEGKFKVKASQNSNITVSFVGLNSDSFNIGRNNQVTVRLRESSQTLNEVVVTALGMRKEQRSLSYSTQSISAAEYSKGEDIEEALNGKVEGVQTEELKDKKIGTSSSDIVPDVSSFVDENVSNNEIENQPRTWNPDRLYLKALAAAPKEKQYELYFELRKVQERNPSFYFDVAHFFYSQGDVKKALQVISNIADLGLENHQLYKTLTYTLRQWKAYDDALYTAKQVAKWRAHEPQSLRDYALALEDAGEYQEAFDQLVKALEVNYYGEMSGQYEGVEDIILMDINRLMASYAGIKSGKLDKKYLQKMPVEIRIIMNWNLMDVDLDLHIIEPTGEECYYGHTTSQAGARFSKDFTEGYGPEQYLIRNAVKGKYQIKTNYFGERELTESGPATVMIEIYTTKAGKTAKTLKTIQLGKVKENELLAEIVW